MGVLRRHGRSSSLVGLVLVGILLGLGAFTFGYGEGAAYLSNDPRACTHCHVMQEHFDSWAKSGHRHVAVCNDCHLPHNPVGKWVTKADNGFFHSLVFTTGDYPDEILIKPRNTERLEEACLHCHAEFVAAMAPAASHRERLGCVHCHQAVGHAQR